MILAGGRQCHLRPLAQAVPKPAGRFCGRNVINPTRNLRIREKKPRKPEDFFRSPKRNLPYRKNTTVARRPRTKKRDADRKSC